MYWEPKIWETTFRILGEGHKILWIFSTVRTLHINLAYFYLKYQNWNYQDEYKANQQVSHWFASQLLSGQNSSAQPIKRSLLLFFLPYTWLLLLSSTLSSNTHH